VSSGVAVVGFSAFGGFGISSQRIFDDLKRTCGASGCGSAQRADADRGKNQQTLANVGLAVGSIGAVAAVTFLVLAVTAPPAEKKGAHMIVTPWGVAGIW